MDDLLLSAEARMALVLCHFDHGPYIVPSISPAAYVELRHHRLIGPRRYLTGLGVRVRRLIIDSSIDRLEKAL
jgi:hypothetical protein